MNTRTNSIKKKILTVLMSFVMIFSIMPMMADEASAYTDNQLTVKYDTNIWSISAENWMSFETANQKFSIRNGKGNTEVKEIDGKKLTDILDYFKAANELTFSDDTIIKICAEDGATTTFDWSKLSSGGYAYDNGNGTKVYPVIADEGNKLNFYIGQTALEQPNRHICLNNVETIEIIINETDETEISDVSAVMPNTDWFDGNSNKNEFLLNNEADIRGFEKLVNEGNSFENKTIKLGNAIKLTGKWTPIGSAEKQFKGTFDGNGFAINGMDIDAGNYKGLFGFNMGTIKNLTVSGWIKGDAAGDYIGGIVGFNGGIIENIVSNVDIEATNAFNVGGVAGINTSGKWYDDANRILKGAKGIIKNCLNNGNVEANKKIGGIAGNNAGTLDSCVNKGTISRQGSGKASCGGIAGMNGNNNTPYSTGIVRNCYNVGLIDANDSNWAGHIVGFNSGKPADGGACQIKNCYSIGQIEEAYKGKNDVLISCNEDNTSGACVNNFSRENLDNEEDKGVSKLGQAYTADTANINNGYPILKWQSATDDNAGINDKPNNDTAKKDSVVKTGDNSNIIPIMILMLIAIAGIVACVRKVRV